MNTESESNQDVPEQKVQAESYTAQELRSAFIRPHQVIEYLLAQRSRWISTVVEGRQLGLLVVLMLLFSVIFAVPYGVVLGPEKFLHVAAMFLGSVAICFPSLHVFGAFLSLRVNLGQNLALVLLITAVSGIFSFGFFPIMWFLRTTMSGQESAGTMHGLSIFLLITAVVIGVLHLCRCLFREKRLYLGSSFWFWTMLFFWQGLLIFITCRMGIYLDLI